MNTNNNNNICRYCTDPVTQGITICRCALVHENCRIINKKNDYHPKSMSDCICDTCHQQYYDIDLKTCVDCGKNNDETSLLVCACGSAHAFCRKSFIKQNKNKFECKVCKCDFQDLLFENNCDQMDRVKSHIKISGFYIMIILVIAMLLLLAGLFGDKVMFFFYIPLSFVAVLVLFFFIMSVQKYRRFLKRKPRINA